MFFPYNERRRYRIEAHEYYSVGPRRAPAWNGWVFLRHAHSRNGQVHPLDRVEQKAQEDWSIDRVDTNTLHLSKFWPGYSISALGYAASLADLVYDHADSVLYVPYYFKIISPFYLFIPPKTLRWLRLGIYSPPDQSFDRFSLLSPLTI